MIPQAISIVFMDNDEIITTVRTETDANRIYVRTTLTCSRRLVDESIQEITLDIFDGGANANQNARFYCIATSTSGKTVRGSAESSLAMALAACRLENLDPQVNPPKKLLTKKDVFDRVFGGFSFGQSLPHRNGDLRLYRVINLHAQPADSPMSIVEAIIENAGEPRAHFRRKRWTQMKSILDRYIKDEDLRVICVVHNAHKWKSETLWSTKRIYEYENGFASNRPAFVFLGAPEPLSTTLYGLPDILARSIELPSVPLQLIKF